MTMKTDDQLIDELEAMYHQVAEETTGDAKSAFEKGVLPLQSKPVETAVPPRRQSRTRLIVLSLVLISLLLSFLWPHLLYHNGLTKSGDRVYPVRTNRLTGDKSYFYNDRWKTNPIPTAQSVRSPITISLTTPLPATAKEEQLPPPVPDQSPAPVTKPSPAPAKPGKYAIQIKAIKGSDGVDEYMALISERGFAPFREEVTITGKGTWNRILIGRFSDISEAIQYMKDNKIAASFPGSFVQKISSGRSRS